MNRRNFLKVGGAASLGVVTSAGMARNMVYDSKKVRIGIVGGGFGASFFFHEDPNCIVEAVSDLRQDRRDHLMKVYGCKKSYPSLEKLIRDPKIDAVFVATEAINHHMHVIDVLNAGKHVMSAVPCAMTLEDCESIKNKVKETGLVYMMAETSYYRQNTISVRKFYQEGQFGELISAAAEYNHPGLESLFFDEKGASTWRRGFPPMNYPTHCTSFLISVTGERLTRVSSLGWRDSDPIINNNQYDNPFWNETAFFETSEGRPFRVEVNWRGAYRGVERGEWRGSKMSFYSPHGGRDNQSIIIRRSEQKTDDEGGFVVSKNTEEIYEQPLWWKTDLLPSPLRHDSGHGGSHTFLTHEFISAIVENRKPAIDIYEAIAYTAPGIVAHHSSLKNGESLNIPNFDD